MKINILKEQIDEAGNVGFVLDEVFEGTEDECLSRLVLLNSTEGYPHIGEIFTEFGCRVIYAPEPQEG